MPIPNVATLYQKISKGSEGGSEFARFVKLLISSEFAKHKIRFISESDASGDHRGVDGYVLENLDFSGTHLVNGYQFKFYSSNLTSNQKNNQR